MFVALNIEKTKAGGCKTMWSIRLALPGERLQGYPLLHCGISDLLKQELIVEKNLQDMWFFQLSLYVLQLEQTHTYSLPL